MVYGAQPFTTAGPAWCGGAVLCCAVQVYSKAAGVAYVSVSHKGGQSGRVSARPAVRRVVSPLVLRDGEGWMDTAREPWPLRFW